MMWRGFQRLLQGALGANLGNDSDAGERSCFLNLLLSSFVKVLVKWAWRGRRKSLGVLQPRPHLYCVSWRSGTGLGLSFQVPGPVLLLTCCGALGLRFPSSMWIYGVLAGTISWSDSFWIFILWESLRTTHFPSQPGSGRNLQQLSQKKKNGKRE